VSGACRKQVKSANQKGAEKCNYGYWFDELKEGDIFRHFVESFSIRGPDLPLPLPGNCGRAIRTRRLSFTGRNLKNELKSTVLWKAMVMYRTLTHEEKRKLDGGVQCINLYAKAEIRRIF
jgi:hypothetical protein